MYERTNFQEPSITKPEAPKQTEYECDILVVGGGYAGITAAITAARAGCRVVLVDKGTPGYSGQSPHACCTRWFDADMDDDREALEYLYVHDGQYLANRNWINVWIDESKSVYELYKELGLCEQYESANVTGHAEKDDFVGYNEFVGNRNRHKRVTPALKKNGVTVVPQTMVCSVIRQSGKVVGAVGFHVPSGEPVVVHAKATIMCMGGGVYKPAGWSSGGNSYDAVAIGYKLGLPIIGHEFEDFHRTRSDAPSNGFWPYGFGQLQNLMLNGGEIRTENLDQFIRSKTAAIMDMGMLFTGAEPFDCNTTGGHPPLWKNKNSNDVRNNRIEEDEPKSARCGTFGVSPGFCAHTTSGIYCGAEDTCGFTGIPGLYCAGDGCNAGPVGGAAYTGRTGFTSNFCGLQGKKAGEAAAEYIQNLELEKIDSDTVSAEIFNFLAPTRLEKGYDVNWALDALQGVMTPFWTLLAKREAFLEAALLQISFIRDTIAPKVVATNSHELRYCLEFKNKVLEAEMKLRVSLTRKESRGSHYRVDYPFRDDAKYLCYFAAKLQADGSMGIERIEIPDDWKGDLSAPYTTRYTSYYPGEKEAVLERGLAKEFSPAGEGTL